MRLSRLVCALSPKFLPSRERIIFKSKKEAFKDFSKVTGANILWQVGLAVLLYEFGFPTADIMYDFKKVISPDFNLYCKYGELAEYRIDFENKLRSVQREEQRYREKGAEEKSPEARFGGLI